MKTIHEYGLGMVFGPVTKTFQVPEDFRGVKAGIQDGQTVVWAEVNPSLRLRTVQIHVFVTGMSVPEDLFYIDTVFDGAYVWHVYQTP